MVDLIDTNGVKPTLKKGVLGYDDYSVGGDAGRLYVGTGTASIAQAKKSEVDSHTSNVSNPHSVTKTQVGLGNVDNTSDVNKPVSTATQTALNTKVDKVTSTDNAIARFDLTSGQIQNSGVIIDDNNNVGIGVAPSAWNSAAKVIDIGTSSFGSYYGALYSNNNTYINSAGSYIYKNTGAAATHYQQNAGQHEWRTAPSGTAGNAITWTNAMTLDSSGNLGIGGTPSGIKLDAYGNGRFLQTSQDTTGAVIIKEDAAGTNGGVIQWVDNTNANQRGYVKIKPNGSWNFGNNSGSILTIDTSSNVLVTLPSGLGYGQGAGGTVTQLTSKSTAVTLNKPTGTITMNNAALAAGAQVVFLFNNSLIGTNDIVIPCLIGGGGGLNYTMYATGGTAGSCGIWVTNKSGGSLSEALVIQYVIIKGAVA